MLFEGGCGVTSNGVATRETINSCPAELGLRLLPRLDAVSISTSCLISSSISSSSCTLRFLATGKSSGR